MQTRINALQNKAVFISCIIPVYNEEAGIYSFIKKLYETLAMLTHHLEIILVDDGSKDHTVLEVKKTAINDSVKLLCLSRNFGKDIALTAGIEHASGDVVILMDADFQHPVEVIPEFLEKWSQGFDMVYAVRQDRENESFLKRNAAHAFYWLMKKMTKMDMPANAGDFRLMDKKIIEILATFPERNRFMKGLYAWVGFNKIGIPFTAPNRIMGKSSWGFAKLTELAITGFTSFSDVPLRIWSYIGFFISCISFIYSMYIVTETLLFGTDFPGFPTLVVAIMFLGGIQLLSIGILGEYIARIFTEVKMRPKYIIKDKIGFE